MYFESIIVYYVHVNALKKLPSLDGRYCAWLSSSSFAAEMFEIARGAVYDALKIFTHERTHVR